MNIDLEAVERRAAAAHEEQLDFVSATAADTVRSQRDVPTLLAAVRAQRDEIERLTTERDAYKRAKAENDDRFMLERDEARIERDALAAEVERLNVEIKGWRRLNASLLRHHADARAVITRVREWAEEWHKLRGPVSVDTRGMARSLLALLPTQDSGEETGQRPSRYDQCDGTCTVDCGHCKGAGTPTQEEQE